MFEILWVAPYDRRRSNAALSGFERCSRETAVLLAATDLRSASPGELQTLLQAVDRLAQTIGRLESEALFSRWQCAEALAQVRRIAAIVQEHAAVAVGWAVCRRRSVAGFCRSVAGLLSVCRRAVCAESVLRRAGLGSNLPCADLLCAESALR